MALADGNGGKKQNYEAQMYSRIKFSNKEEHLSLGFSFWKGLLIITISEEKSSYSGIEYNEVAKIHLSPIKAHLLADQLRKLKVDRTTETAYGINTGMGEVQTLITFMNEKDSTEELPKRKCVICKLDSDGNLQEVVEFHLNTDYYYTLEYSDFSKVEFEKSFDNDLELDEFIMILDSFAVNMNGTVGYAVMDVMRWDATRQNNKLDQIMDALNIERKSGRGNQGNNNNSYFNRNGAASTDNSNRARSNHRSVEDLEDLE